MLLTELAVRSKAHWGYDAEFLREARADLTVSAESIGEHPVYVAEEGGEVVGFYRLCPEEGGAVELDLLFVEPRAIGRGCGAALWRHAVGEARAAGFPRLVVASDPNAVRFYEAMGARRVGTRESPVRPGRLLPLLARELV